LAVFAAGCVKKTLRNTDFGKPGVLASAIFLPSIHLPRR